MLTLYITPDVLVSGIIGHIEITEASELQMQILIPASPLNPASRKGTCPFQIMIEKDNHVHGLTATRGVCRPAAGACVHPFL